MTSAVTRQQNQLAADSYRATVTELGVRLRRYSATSGDRRLDLSGLDPTRAERLRRTCRPYGPVRTVEATPPVGESTQTARHAAQAWLIKKQADR